MKRKAAEGKREAPVGPRRQMTAETAVVEMVGVEKKERRHRLTSSEDDGAEAIVKEAKADAVNGALTRVVTVNEAITEAVTEAVTVNEAVTEAVTEAPSGNTELEIYSQITLREELIYI